MTVQVLDCEGAPRDLGFDQGRACRSVLQAHYRRESGWLQRLPLPGFRRGGAGSDRLVRDLTRYFPQQSEAIEGMVRGAGVPYRWLAAALARALAEEESQQAVDAVAADPSLTHGGPLLARSFAAPPVARRSRPEGGIASVELTLPWLTAALAGVNAGGLAAASVTLPSGGEPNSCAAPAALLVQDCLTRFDSVDGAVDWCRGRPAGGRATILLADATGAVAVVEIHGGERRLVSSDDGFALVGAGAQEAVNSLRIAAPLSASALATALGTGVAVLDPGERRIAFLATTADSPLWLAVDPVAEARG